MWCSSWFELYHHDYHNDDDNGDDHDDDDQDGKDDVYQMKSIKRVLVSTKCYEMNGDDDGDNCC